MTKRAFTVDTGLVPGDSTADLGVSTNKFDELNISGDGNIAGDLTVSGTITGTVSGGSGVSDSQAIAYAIALG